MKFLHTLRNNRVWGQTRCSFLVRRRLILAVQLRPCLTSNKLLLRANWITAFRAGILAIHDCLGLGKKSHHSWHPRNVSSCFSFKASSLTSYNTCFQHYRSWRFCHSYSKSFEPRFTFSKYPKLVADNNLHLSISTRSESWRRVGKIYRRSACTCRSSISDALTDAIAQPIPILPWLGEVITVSF